MLSEGVTATATAAATATATTSNSTPTQPPMSPQSMSIPGDVNSSGSGSDSGSVNNAAVPVETNDGTEATPTKTAPTITTPPTTSKRTSEERNFHLRESERLLFFTDAVVAIAATLLILPLMEAATSFGQSAEEETEGERRHFRRILEEVENTAGGAEVHEEQEGETVADFFRENGGHMGAFVLSFLYVCNHFWKGHAFLFTYVEFISAGIFILNMLCTLSAVFFPVAASLLFVSGTSDHTSATLLYLGVVWSTNIFILILKILIRRDPRTWTEEYGSPTEYSLLRSIVAVGIGAVTMIVGGTIPNSQHGWMAISLYLLSGPILNLTLKCRPQLKAKRSVMDIAHDYYLNADFISETRRYLSGTTTKHHFHLRKLLGMTGSQQDAINKKESAFDCREKGEASESQCFEKKDMNTSNQSNIVSTDTQNSKKKEDEVLSSNVFEGQGSNENDDAETLNPRLLLAKANKSVLLRVSDRLIIFTDATIAISMTLLIVPLMEKSSELMNTTASEFFEENARLGGSFVLSFWIIAGRWLRHDNMFAFIEGHVPANFMLFTIPWLMSITFMPVATALFVINDNAQDRGKYGVYLGTLLLNLLLSIAMSFIVYRENKKFPPIKVLESIVVTILCGLGLLVAMLVPTTGSYMPLLIFFSHPLTLLLLKLWPSLLDLV